mmetsp:Transcript_28720/g.37678  ORF Transcript_28720/g.37678 Transcript_28720/m.37678 type:complete len:440 (-) Transcript_28720:300-1619(-)
MVLTEKQRGDLHSAIHDYLVGLGDGFAQSANTFFQEANLEENHRPQSNGLLEKKWTSVVRLQRKVMELEQKLQQAELDLKNSPANRAKQAGDSRLLPRGPPRQSMSGHRSPITTVAIHPVYSVVASGSEDATVRVWDYESGEYERQLKGHTNAIQHVAFNQDGSLLVSCSSDLSLKLWDFSTYECVKTMRGHDHNVSCAIFLASGDQVVSCSRDNTIKFWEVSTGYCVRTLTGHTDWVRALALSADGTLLASCGNDQSVMVWPLNTAPGATQVGEPLVTLREHSHVVECVVFAPSKRRLPPPPPSNNANATANATGASSEEEMKSGQAVDGAPGQGEMLATGSRDRTVKLWDVFAGQCLMTFSDHDNWVRGLVYHPSGKFLITASDDRSIRVFDIKNQRCIRTIEEAHSHFVTSIGMSPVTSVLISGSVDKNINVWECR